MPDYSKTIIYKIVCRDLSILDIYVGHTTNVSVRKSQHKFICNNYKDKHHNIYVYQFIRDHGGWSNWDMIEICCIECVDRADSQRHERKYIEDLGATLNMVIPGRTSKEYNKQYYAKNIEYRLEYLKQYRLKNKDSLTESRRLKRQQKKLTTSI